METKSLGLLTVSQAADYLNIPRPTLYQHLREGRIPGIQIGGRWRIESKVLERFLGLQFDGASSSSETPATIPGNRQVAPPSPSTANSELERLIHENKRLRAIIAQQLLELHELQADTGTAIFQKEGE